MRYNLHLREELRTQVSAVAGQMNQWEQQPRFSEEELSHIHDNLTFFAHTTTHGGLRIAGVDGSGDFPALSYADSFVYLAVASGTIYESDPLCGLRETGPGDVPLFQLVWLPEDRVAARQELDAAFERLANNTLSEVIHRSDYREIKAHLNNGQVPEAALIGGLIRPDASDSGNLAVQLRSTAELGMACRLIQTDPSPDYVMIDTTLSLPLATRKDAGLFYEHLKRLCCVEAREKGICFLASSKSHGLAGMEIIEGVARDKAEDQECRIAEHWYLRLPLAEEGWSISSAAGRQLPPHGAVTYLVRFHKNTPVMRVDMDRVYWQSAVQGSSPEITCENERAIFQDLDYASHDQRAYGYPYPIKAGHDRASMSKPERTALRNQVIDAAVEAGLNRTLFRNASIATGHQ